MNNFTRLPEVKEVTKQELQELSRELFNVQAMMETAALALYHVQDEPEPVSQAVIISVAVASAAKRLEEINNMLMDSIC